jgi:hypothetical protein
MPDECGFIPVNIAALLGEHVGAQLKHFLKRIPF